MIEEFNVDWKAECGQLNLAHLARNKQIKKKKLKQTNAGWTDQSTILLVTIV